LDILILLGKTLILRPYVFGFLAMSLFVAKRLLGWKRAGVFFGITWLIGVVSEFASTRIGIPFGHYFYNGSTSGEELYIFNVPFMVSLSYPFLLFASYCLALLFALPRVQSSKGATPTLSYPGTLSWPILLLASFFFMYIDIVIDPIALRGDRWFLGLIYGYTHPGTYFGIPLGNFAGWFVVGFVSLSLYRWVERIGYFTPLTLSEATMDILLGCGLYYVVLIFNLAMTFWIEEWLLGMVGCVLYLPVTILALFRLPFWFPTIRKISQPDPG
jgi:putative membrane protein